MEYPNNNTFNNVLNNNTNKIPLNRLERYLVKSGLGPKLRIFIYTWNMKNITTTIDDPDNEIYTDFQHMIQSLKKRKCKIVIFCFQNDQDNSLFSKIVLRNIMMHNGFILPGDSQELSNKNSLIGEYKPAVGKSILRTLLYVDEDWYKRMKNRWWAEMKIQWYKKLIPNRPNKLVINKLFRMEHFSKSCNLTDDNLLGLLSTFTIPGYGKMGILNIDFKDKPEIYKKMKELFEEKKRKFIEEYKFEPRKKDFVQMYDSIYEITRQSLINDSNKCLMKIIEKAKAEKVDTLFLSGSMNYKFTLGEKFQNIPRILEMMSYHYNHITRFILSRYDEIAKQFHYQNIDSFSEGIDNMGPSFPPTCILSPGRDERCHQEVNWNENTINNVRNDLYNRSCYLLNNEEHQEGKLGWCDRIFYHHFNTNINLECTSYTTSDFPSFTGNNNHRAVMGIFELSIPSSL
jgi:hypothetical protein